MGLLYRPSTRAVVSPKNINFEMKSIVVLLVVVITLWIGMIQCQSLKDEDQLIEERGKENKDEILMKLNKKLKKMGFGSRPLQKRLRKIDSMAKDLAALG